MIKADCKAFETAIWCALLVNKTLKCCKSFTGHSGEAQNTEQNEDNTNSAHEFQMGTETVGDWVRGHTCYTPEKKLDAFCPGPEHLS